MDCNSIFPVQEALRHLPCQTPEDNPHQPHRGSGGTSQTGTRSQTSGRCHICVGSSGRRSPLRSGRRYRTCCMQHFVFHQ
ncbi:hypothetical protein GDO78_018995 [Eleutherodactylus coqui]|uniref:Uncharacterized protein n=1 Tax=Eleutherodactylus coqui TaxID=57060 RepID=A0A8J6EBR5_ELECQ|nr:hypothetical protein GDO78_018995 [Eleutherodactylus coqui]